MNVISGVFLAADLPQLSEDGRRAATAMSANCPHCGGGGLVIVDSCSPHSRGKTAGATCLCVLGRWIRAWHATNSRDLLDSLPDLCRIVDGRDRDWTFDGFEEGDDE